MRLINVHTLEFSEFFTVHEEEIPPYAILSHTWGEGEMNYKDWLKKRNLRGPGYEKVIRFCRLVRETRLFCREYIDKRGLQNGKIPLTQQIDWVWIDTCCIDKKSSAELSEAINSMWKWYRHAMICFVYLTDYVQGESGGIGDSFGECVWFSRGWTLQELLAPFVLCFCDASWAPFGLIWSSLVTHMQRSIDIQSLSDSLRVKDRDSLVHRVSSATGIPVACILKSVKIEGLSVAERMSWAANRRTSRQEDVAYCLLGLLDVNMPLLYGEGDKAFMRLQEVLRLQSADSTIFVHQGDWVTARHPKDFKDSKTVKESLGSHKILHTRTSIGLEMREDLYGNSRLDGAFADVWASIPYSKLLLLDLRCFANLSQILLITRDDSFTKDRNIMIPSDVEKDVRLVPPRRLDVLKNSPNLGYMIFMLLSATEGNSRSPLSTTMVKLGLLAVSTHIDVNKVFEKYTPDHHYYITN